MAQPRTYALDNVRTYLTVLVIVHHAVIAYGGGGSWAYTSPHHTQGSSPILLSFNATNQTYFMATFFLLSGFFSSIAAKKRTRRQFIIEKWRRLGVPTLVYSVLSRGLLSAIIKLRAGQMGWGGVPKEIWEGVKSIRGVRGPVWYCALLLVFDVLYTLLRPKDFAAPGPTLLTLSPTSNQDQSAQSSDFGAVPAAVDTHTAAPPEKTGPFRTAHVLALLALSASSSFVLRLVYPTGTDLKPLNVQPGYASQYILYYIAGLHVHRSGRKLHGAISTHTTCSAAAVTIAFDVLGFFNVKEQLKSGVPFEEIAKMASGGWSVIAFVYAFWNEFTGLVLASLLLRAFNSTRLSFLSTHWTIFRKDIAKYSYAAFLLHPLLVVETQTALDEEKWTGPLLKAAYVGVVGVLKSWLAGVVLKEFVDWAVGKGYV